MGETAIIRAATEADIAPIIDINKTSLAGDYVNGKDLTAQFWRDWCDDAWARNKAAHLANLIQAPEKGSIYVAEIHGDVVGYVRTTENECSGNYVRYLQRQRGVASGAIVLALGAIEARGHSTAWAGVADAQFARVAHLFYQRCGFHRTDEKLPASHNGRPGNFDDVRITLHDVRTARHQICERLGVSAVALETALEINLKPPKTYVMLGPSRLLA